MKVRNEKFQIILLFLVFLSLFSFFFTLSFSLQSSHRITNIKWLNISEGGEISFTDNYINLTHLRNVKGRVALISEDIFSIYLNITLVWITRFSIIDVVDPSGEKTHSEAETRQRILLIDSETNQSLLPFDFGFFEATTEDPLGGNRLHIFWGKTLPQLLTYGKEYTLEIRINATTYIVEVYNLTFYWKEMYTGNFKNKRVRLLIEAGESVGRGGNIVIFSTFVTYLHNITEKEGIICVPEVDKSFLPFLSIFEAKKEKNFTISYCEKLGSYLNLLTIWLEGEEIYNLYPLNSSSIYLNSTNKEDLLYSITLAGYLGLPLITQENKNLLQYYPPKYIINNKEQAIEIYLNEVKKRNENIDRIVVANLNSDNSFLASRYAFLFKGFPIFINLSINQNEYENCKVQSYYELLNPFNKPEVNFSCSINQKANYVRNQIIKTIKFLNSKDFLYNSLEYKLNNSIPKIVIIGNEYEIPFFKLPFVPHYFYLEIPFNQKDDYVLSDSIYCNFNFSIYLENLLAQQAICSRIYGNVSQTSFQIELARFFKPKNILIIGNKANVEEIKEYFNKLESAFYTYKILRDLNATLKIEKQTNISEISLETIPKIIFDVFKRIKKFENSDLLLALTIVDLILKAQTYSYEFNWFEFFDNLKQLKFKPVKSFEEIKKEDLENYDFIIYFGDYENNKWKIKNSTHNFTIDSFQNIKLLVNSHSRSFQTTLKNYLNFGAVSIIAITSNYSIPVLDAFIYDVLKNKNEIGYSIFREKNINLANKTRTLNSITSVNYFFDPDLNLYKEKNVIVPLAKVYEFNEFKAKKEEKIIFGVFNISNKTYVIVDSDDLYFVNLTPIYVNKYDFEIQAKKIKEIKFKKEVEEIESENQINYTKDFFEYSIVDLENGKKLVILNVYPVVYESSKTKILKSFEFEIIYEPKIEFKRIEQINKKLKLQIFSDDYYNATLKLFFENYTIEKNLTLQKNDNVFELELPYVKNVNVTLLIETEDYFTKQIYELKEEKIEEPFYKFISNFLKILRNWKIEIKEEFEKNKYKKEITTPFYKVEKEIIDNSIKIKLISFDRKYEYFENSSISIEFLETYYGKIKIIYNLGNRFIECSNNCEKLIEIIEETKKWLEKIFYQ